MESHRKLTNRTRKWMVGRKRIVSFCASFLVRAKCFLSGSVTSKRFETLILLPVNMKTLDLQPQIQHINYHKLIGFTSWISCFGSHPSVSPPEIAASRMEFLKAWLRWFAKHLEGIDLGTLDSRYQDAEFLVRKDDGVYIFRIRDESRSKTENLTLAYWGPGG